MSNSEIPARGSIAQTARLGRVEVRCVVDGLAEVQCRDRMLRYVDLDELTVIEVPAVEHRTRTYPLGAERPIRGRDGVTTWASCPDAGWLCTCGVSGRADNRTQAQWGARHHRTSGTNSGATLLREHAEATASGHCGCRCPMCAVPGNVHHCGRH